MCLSHSAVGICSFVVWLVHQGPTGLWLLHLGVPCFLPLSPPLPVKPPRPAPTSLFNFVILHHCIFILLLHYELLVPTWYLCQPCAHPTQCLAYSRCSPCQMRDEVWPSKEQTILICIHACTQKMCITCLSCTGLPVSLLQALMYGASALAVRSLQYSLESKCIFVKRMS